VRGAHADHGEDLFAVPESGPDDVAAAIDAATRGVPGLARGARPGARRARQAVRGTARPSTSRRWPTWSGVEVGKIRSEALGEIQEMIDICDFAVGLSRQLEGRTMPSERPGHRLMETWHPLGVVGVISAFNFPAAVWSWNAALALVCGDTVVWKASELTPLTSHACSALLARAAVECGAPKDLNVLVVGGAEAAAPLLDSRLVLS
jgi:aldehyde dehydrogenase (NAD+)